MNTQIDMSQTVKLVFSDLAQDVIAIGRASHHRFRIVGFGPVPEKPFFRGEWYYEPVETPSAGREVLDLLKSSGVAYKGIVVAHEVVLVEGPTDTNPQTNHNSKASDVNIQDLNNILPAVLGVVGLVVTGLLYGFIWALAHDPALIVILEDDTWVELWQWYE